jgi:hypothetical protein
MSERKRECRLSFIGPLAGFVNMTRACLCVGEESECD